MKTTVVCGLLGSGKTTFIRNFVSGGYEKTGKSGKTAKSGKTVVLVNDFAKAGIDGEIFSAGGIESVELPSGCICCTLKLDLITTIQSIVKQFSPEHLLIEPSGVASPSGVLEAIESAGTGSASVIGIVDATEFAELYESGMYGSFFEDQIVNSDVILVNKTDLATGPAIDAAERLISTGAILFRTVNAKSTCLCRTHHCNERSPLVTAIFILRHFPSRLRTRWSLPWCNKYSVNFHAENSGVWPGQRPWSAQRTAPIALISPSEK